MLVARALDHVGDRNDRDGRARAEAGGREAGGQTALVRKPLERVAYAGAVDAARADARDDGADIEMHEARRVCVDHPAERGAERAADHDGTRPELVDEPAFDRNQPGFGDDENGECGLDRGLPR